MNWREPVLNLLKVPPVPSPPPGSKPRVFRAAPNYLTLRIIVWSFAQVFALIGLIIALFVFSNAMHRAPRGVVIAYRLFETFGFAAFVAQLLYGLAVVRLDYEMRWYMVSDRSIRIREGIGIIREKTIALANIQNIGIRQGPLQRLLGISDVEVKTAGGGGHEDPRKKQMGEPMHIAYFRGVDNAEEIRSIVMEGVRRQRNTGLGDPDEHHQHEPRGRVSGELESALEVLLTEARRLRTAAEGQIRT